jgi:hypothetical protein
VVDQLGADHRDLAWSIDAEAYLAALESNDGHANLVADVDLFHQLSRQNQHDAFLG